MDSVKVNRDELLKTVRENKDKHVKEYNEAVEDFKNAALKVINENIDLLNSGKTKVKNLPPAPTSYEVNYSRAIRMLEMSVDTVIELDQYEFAKLVLDEWEWKEMFSTMNSTYKSF